MALLTLRLPPPVAKKLIGEAIPCPKDAASHRPRGNRPPSEISNRTFASQPLFLMEPDQVPTSEVWAGSVGDSESWHPVESERNADTTRSSNGTASPWREYE